jgi:hypothetical protein
MVRPILSAALLALGLGALATPAAALSTKDCSVKYQAAKQAGTLNGQKWNDFRKAECGAPPDAAANTVPNPMAPGATKPPSPVPAPTTTAAKPTTAPAATGTAAYPSAVDQGSDAHLPRQLQRGQGCRHARRRKVDPEGRRLLLRLQRAAEKLNGYPTHRATPRWREQVPRRWWDML